MGGGKGGKRLEHQRRRDRQCQDLDARYQDADLLGADEQFELALEFYILDTPASIRKAVTLFEKAAAGGHAGAKHELACIKYDGKHLQKDWVEAFRLWKSAVEKEDVPPLSVYYLGQCYEHGRGTDIDIDQALRTYKKAAQKGSEKACLNLGRWYELGTHVGVDPYKALEYYSKAAVKKDVEGIHNLARCYEKGIGTDVDEQKAFAYYEKAAKQGYHPAQHDVGRCYEQSIGTQFDKEKAWAWFMKAAKSGHPYAQCSVASCYLAGEDIEEALTWFEKAVDSGSKEALGELKECSLKVKTGAAALRAFNAFKKAERKGFSAATSYLAECYKSGFGTDKDLKKAFHLYEKGALNGQADAFCQYNYAVCFELGEGTDKDYEKAMEWYAKASESGDDGAIYNMGCLILNDLVQGRTRREGLKLVQDSVAKQSEDAYCELGVRSMTGIQEGEDTVLPVDCGEAVKCFKVCLEKSPDHPRALGCHGYCFETGRGEVRDVERAIQMYKRAVAIKEDPHLSQFACYRLGVCYETGAGVSKDLSEAISYYNLSLEYVDKDPSEGWPGLRDSLLEALGRVNAAMAPMSQRYEVTSPSQEEPIDGDEQETFFGHAGQTSAAEMCELGVRYMTGVVHDGGDAYEIDYSEAAKCFKACLAKSPDHPRALGCHGYCFETGRGEARDMERAIQMYKRAVAITEDPHLSQFACYRLGVCYETGAGVSKDLSEALSYYYRSLEYVDKDPSEGWPGLRDSVRDALRRVVLSALDPPTCVKDAAISLLGKRKREGEEEEETSMSNAQSRRRLSLTQALDVTMRNPLMRSSVNTAHQHNRSAESEVNEYRYNTAVMTYGLTSGDMQVREAASSALQYVTQNAERMQKMADTTSADLQSNASEREGGACINMNTLSSPHDSLLAHHIEDELRAKVGSKLSALSPQSESYLRELISLLLEESNRVQIDLLSLPRPLLERLFSLPAEEVNRIHAEMERCCSYLDGKNSSISLREYNVFVSGDTSEMSSGEVEVNKATWFYLRLPSCAISAWKCKIDSTWKAIEEQKANIESASFAELRARRTQS